jgi:FkbM family methyltransferase
MSFISYAQNFEDLMLWRALKHIKKGFYIDVGANDPEDDSVTKAFYDRGWHGINIEPEKRFFEKLQAERTRDLNLDVAVSDQKDPIEIYMFEKRGWSTGNKEVAEAHKANGEMCKVEKILTQSLDSICQQYNVDEIHFLKIDVEGAEKSVLQSFSFGSVRPWIVVIEATKPNTNIDISSEWENILFDHQYRFAYFDGINKFYVSEEHSELLDAFKSPPNILDHFMKAAQYHAETNASLCAEEFKKCVTKLKHLDKEKQQILNDLDAEREAIAREQHALQQLQYTYDTLKQQHEEILNSHSWRVTYPLRLAAHWLSGRKKESHKKQFLLDLSQIYFHDDGTGIQRVIHHIRKEISVLLPEEYQLTPIYATAEESYRYTAKFGPKHTFLEEHDEQPVTVKEGDIFLGLDLGAHLFPAIEETLLSYRNKGVSINFVIYDIIPLRYPEFTTEGIATHFQYWINGLVKCADQCICISHSVAREVETYITSHFHQNAHLPKITSFHLGADFQKNSQLSPLRKEVESILSPLKKRETFLMVGTIEPRKGHAQVLEAFELLWEEGSDAVLLFVGKAGWNTEMLITRIKNHPQRNKKLFWLQNASDSELIESYKSSTCYIMASYAEGFGLPIIEAAHYNVPIIARDISVFHEVAGEHAFYFKDDKKASTLKEAITHWQKHYNEGTYPRPEGIPEISWKESSEELLRHLKVNSSNVQILEQSNEK